MKHIITAALPYANGSIHIGHLLEYMQADIFTRFLKLIGEDALYICASDMHGTPIEVNAKKAGLTPEQFTQKFKKEHEEDFKSYLINFDNYHSTNSKENKELAIQIFNTLKEKDLIYIKKMAVIYCEHCQRSLPDRFVKGVCPHCTTADQYGDICESCGSALKGTDLINPKCTICAKSPIIKDSEHYFFKLSALENELKEWLNNANVQPEVKNWLDNWFEKGLEDWCVSREAPYFGFEIPDDQIKEKRYFYVWLDAPLGYISSTINHTENWQQYWKEGKVHQFIGKDIAYFHFLFWPAMLLAAGYPLPNINVHGFITVNGKKMSKSRGTFFTAKEFLEYFPPETLRFYYASHLDRKLTDIDLSFQDFQAVINNVLVANVGNFCYRTLTFAKKNYAKIEASKGEDINFTPIKEAYQNLNLKEAVKLILQLADQGNAYFQQNEVWKDKEGKKEVVAWCVNLARNLSILLSPILPEFAKKVQSAFNEELTWKDLSFSWQGELQSIPRLIEKVDKLPQKEAFPLKLQVGEIIEVSDHPNADSLYLLKVNFGTEERQVVAGLKKHFEKEQLFEQKAVFCTNLKPAKIRGEASEAMILVADDKESISLLHTKKTPIGELATFGPLLPTDKQVTFNDFKELTMLTKEGHVYYNDHQLKTKHELVTVHGVKEGARLF